ncbi:MULTISPECIES: branched-chain amino acid ABC transporter permease [Paraburkholderia]|uniref:branched-chain amino acid ABC transporter permease n=1 Tax=Paraburkholderia TaxID=1822464 RepID=UPI00224F04E1|nr:MULTISPECIES: branched-chain amino acid ABC transporter permease [Paraburkholderia]MCX4162315.1 branched-chain amino acid ABC transporter permease [Paraburkholderia megapolitana]MDN7157810.1 branched-chain amino acid ABC transporter permease [Paraburkholderia sp. CHISQ3]MDQ6494857.1 branched-chain amino acid ABC transporter permease [Paraburkholderia megapolitana]
MSTSTPDAPVIPGPNALERFSRSWKSAALTLAVGVVLLVALPHMLDDFALVQATIYVVMSILAVSLGFIWGFGGILCFGQSAFFGLGAYTYAIAVTNLGDSTVPFLLAIVLPAAFAAVLGYLIFYGRLSDVYMGVITLTVTLILFNLINSTAGPEWKIGNAPLGGFNGIPGIAPLNVPGNIDDVIGPRGLFELSLGALLLVYVLLRALLALKVGRVIVAGKENEQRLLLLGYDTRAYKLFTFVLGAAIAGLAGCLFANWGAFTSPTIFGLAQSAQIIIWVIVGGLGTLVGPIVGCVAIQWLTTQIGTQQTVNSNLVLGAILVGFVLMLPRGIVPAIGSLGAMLVRKLRGGTVAATTAEQRRASAARDRTQRTEQGSAAETAPADPHREAAR